MGLSNWIWSGHKSILRLSLSTFLTTKFLFTAFFAAVIAFAQPAYSFFSEATRPRREAIVADVINQGSLASFTRELQQTIRQIAVVRTVLSSIRKQEKVISGLTLLQ